MPPSFEYLNRPIQPKLSGVSQFNHLLKAGERKKTLKKKEARKSAEQRERERERRKEITQNVYGLERKKKRERERENVVGSVDGRGAQLLGKWPPPSRGAAAASPKRRRPVLSIGRGSTATRIIYLTSKVQ